MQTARINEIDILRFLSAIAVMVFHYAFRGYTADGYSPLSYPMLFPIAKYGYLGVNLFFMISGFVILMTVSDGNMSRFLISRFTRLYPAFWACCTITFVVTSLFGESRLQISLSNYLVNMTMLGGLFRVPLVDGVYWSLFVEIKFYAIVLAILMAGQIRRIDTLLWLWLAVALTARAVPSWTLQSIVIADYAPLFIAGAVFSRIRFNGASAGRISLIAICWLVATYDEMAQTAAVSAQFGVAFDAAAIGATLSAFFAAMALVASGRTGWVGRADWGTFGAMTYPLYLLHQNIGYVVFTRLYAFVNQHLLFWGTVAFMLAAAYVIYVGVERRFAPIMRRALSRVHSDPNRV